MRGPDLMTIVVVSYILFIYNPMHRATDLGVTALPGYKRLSFMFLLLGLEKITWWHFSAGNGVISERCICLVCRWGECLLGVPTQWYASC